MIDRTRRSSSLLSAAVAASFVLLATVAVPTASLAADGMIHVRSAHDFETTCERLEAAIDEKKLTLFKSVHHSKAAAEIDIDLEPSELYIVGNPKVGSPLIQCAPSVAIDLPQKILVWMHDGAVTVSYNDPAYLVERHHIEGCDEVVMKIDKALSGLAQQATSGE